MNSTRLSDPNDNIMVLDTFKSLRVLLATLAVPILLLAILLTAFPRATSGLRSALQRIIIHTIFGAGPRSKATSYGGYLKYLLVPLFYGIVFVETILYGLVRILVFIIEEIYHLLDDEQTRSLRKQMNGATTYEEWYEAASALDKIEGRAAWQDDLTDQTSEHFNWPLLTGLQKDLKRAMEDGDVGMVLAILQQVARRNVGGIMSEELYSFTYTGEPKRFVMELIDDVTKALQWIAENGKEDIQSARAIMAIKASYGRRALCLSGGGMMGCYHFGHIRALLEADMLPHIMSGSSAGSLVAALACTRTDEELKRDLKPEIIEKYWTCCARPWPERLESLWKTGAMFDQQDWIERTEWMGGNLTFAEAYQKSGRTLCICLSTTNVKSPPVMLNHILTPNILISSAVVASSSIPGVLLPSKLLEKSPTDGTIKQLPEEYWDGSIEQDIPTLGLAEMFNVHHLVAAQTNPHLLPFVSFQADGLPGTPTLQIGCRRGGHLLSGLELFLKMSMRFKLEYIQQVGADTGFTSKLFTQNVWGNTNLIPTVTLRDYLMVVDNPTVDDLKRYIQGGSIAAYKNLARIRLAQVVQRALMECAKSLGSADDKILWEKVVEEKKERSRRMSRYTMFEVDQFVKIARKSMGKNDDDEDKWVPLDTTDESAKKEL